MRFGMSLYPFERYPDAAAIFETARLADSLGFDTITIGEHVVRPNSVQGRIPAKWYDSLVLGTAIAAVTRRVRIFFSVLVLPYYNPVRLAKALATLDVLSGGRLIVGVGTGWLREEFDILGVPFADRGQRTDEIISAMKVLWTSENPSFKSERFEFSDLAFDPRPLQKPHPPIWIGGFGKNALRRAAALGDGLYPVTMGPLSRIVSDMQEVREMLARNGRNPEAFSFAHAIDYGGTTRARAIGTASPVKNLEELNFGYEAEPILAHADASQRAGISQICVRFPGANHHEVMDAMRRFHAEVMSRLPSPPTEA